MKVNREQRRAALHQAFERAQAALPRPVVPVTPETPEPAALSDARLAANRANAQLSTGPKTAEGKAASSRNSSKHGLYSKQLIMNGEDPAKLDALRADLFAEHQPATETEALLVQEMADQYWRLLRSRRMEAALFSGDDMSIAHMTAVGRFMASAERGFHKALKTLTDLQKRRGFVPQSATAPNSGKDEAAPLSEPKTQEMPFVPQKVETAAAAATANSHPEPTTPLTIEEMRTLDEQFAAFDHSLAAA